MVSFTRSLAAAGIAMAVTSSSTLALEEGDYFRPASSVTSGIYGTTAAYRRSPCPALNTLANHGYLPRNGQNITHDMLSTALENVYNIGSGVAAILVSQVPDTINLDYLGIHNKIEHDASLAHTDAYYGYDPMKANETLAEDLFSRAGSDGLLTNKIVAATRKDRGKTCNAENPECQYGVKAQTLAFLEASVLLMALGTGDTISVEHARSFIMDEKFPADYEAPKSTVGVVELLARAATLKAESLV
uniref:Heme haloperoxidase family profile domain-containing protein n=2 Tax=Phytophthora ramorum TaxID=164328 RepID=H3GUM0_PHYRM